MEIKFVEREKLLDKPTGELGFGRYFTDYMFMLDYEVNKGFYDARIVPYADININPATMVLHYAQETFEGLKAYKSKDGRILLFRPEMNAKRMQVSNERLCMPQVPVEDFIKAINELVKIEESWIPKEEGTSLYIRPFMFATESCVGVHSSRTYKFMVVCSPVGAYYPEGVNPIKIYVEDEYVRATKGGTGFAKCGANYAISIAAQEKAKKLGYTQVLWLDGVHRKYIEEVGTMNVMFLIDNEIYTAPLDGTILSGVTRDSILHILKDWGYKINEVSLSIDEIMVAGKEGRLQEAFGTGTAAVISPIGELNYKGDIITLNNFEIGDLTRKLYDTLTNIQWGNIEDKYNWIYEVK